MAERLALANHKLSQFLAPFELQHIPIIHVRIGEQLLAMDNAGTQLAQWDVDYAWFYAEPSEGGGTDAYYKRVDEWTIGMWDSYCEDGEVYREIRNSLSIGHFWSFRRSAGQPAIINLAYGLIASAVAELTEGYLHSDDGAFSGGPIRSAEFDRQYFVPDLARTFGDASWYESCLDSIREEYHGRPFELKYQRFEDNDLAPHQRLIYYPSGRLYREGPAADDRLFVMLTPYEQVPYLYVAGNLMAKEEQMLIQVMRGLDIKEGYRFGRQPKEMVLDYYNNINLEDRSITFWTNPLFIRNEAAIREQLV